MRLAATGNVLATLGRLQKSLDAAAAFKGEQLDGELKAAVEELTAKKAAFALATNDLAKATRNLADVLQRCAKGKQQLSAWAGAKIQSIEGRQVMARAIPFTATRRMPARALKRT